MPYGISTTVRTMPLPTIVRCMTRAIARPSTNSIATETRVTSEVTMKACHQNPSLSTAT